MGSLNRKASSAQCFIMALGLTSQGPADLEKSANQIGQSKSVKGLGNLVLVMERRFEHYFNTIFQMPLSFLIKGILLSYFSTYLACRVGCQAKTIIYKTPVGYSFFNNDRSKFFN